MRTYLGISVAGRNSTCLLDTGCELSMLPRRFVPTTPVEPTKVRIFAANGTKIPVMGAVTINFAVADIPVSCRFLVSDAVDEPMLGIDWLERNNCAWDFTRRSLTISGREVPLVGPPRRPTIRRVYVMEDVVVPPLAQVEVPVRLAWTTYEKGANDTEWLMDTKYASPGVIVARSLLPRKGSKTFVRAVNLSDTANNLPAELCVGCAYPAVVVSGRPDREMAGSAHGDNIANPSHVEEGASHAGTGEPSQFRPATLAQPQLATPRQFGPATFDGAQPFLGMPHDVGSSAFVKPCRFEQTSEASLASSELNSEDFAYLQPVIDSFAHVLSANEFIVAERLV